jgi:ribosomal protein S18 acetylase RimI-like enzyme
MTEPIRGDGGGMEIAEIEVRPAVAADREAVLAFGGEEREVGAVTAKRWDAWLADEDGALLVAVLDGRPVGVVDVRVMSADTGWLEGLRVDPAYRGRGVGRTLLSRALAAADARGVAIVRQFVAPDDAICLKLLRRFGFAHIAEVERYEGPALVEEETDSGIEVEAEQVEDQADELADQANEPGGRRLTLAGEEDLGRIQEWLEHSNLAPFNDGFEFLSDGARKLVEPALRKYLRAGHIWLLEEWETIQALAVALEGEGASAGTLEVRYIDGSSEGISRLALVLREVAAERELASVALWLPHLLILRDAMDGAGYTLASDGPLWIFTRVL